MSERPAMCGVEMPTSVGTDSLQLHCSDSNGPVPLPPFHTAESPFHVEVLTHSSCIVQIRMALYYCPHSILQSPHSMLMGSHSNIPNSPDSHSMLMNG